MAQRLAFIGLGNMGGPMAANLAKAGFAVAAFDRAEAALERAEAAGCARASDVTAAATGAEVILTMLPQGDHVKAVAAEAMAAATPGALLIDCSTIDVAAARAVAAEAAQRGFAFVDAPVSGGVAAAAGASLTFMVGGEPAAFARAEPYLKAMGKAVIHAGAAGAGQAAKICNNMLLGISMIGVCEAFVLAEKLGLDAQTFFDISSKASGQCWSMTSYCPAPGPVPTSPANRDYAPGFATAMMLKDLRLARAAAMGVGASSPLGAHAEALYALFAASGGAEKDFSGIIEFLAGKEVG